MSVNGESVYEVTPFGGNPPTFQLYLIGMVGCRGSTTYLHVFNWPGTRLTTASIKNRVVSARMLATGAKVRCVQEGDWTHLVGLPATAPDPYDTVITLELEGRPEGIPEFRPMP